MKAKIITRVKIITKSMYIYILKNILFIYLFLRVGKGRRKRGRETSMCGCLLCAPNWGPGPEPRHVP